MKKTLFILFVFAFIIGLFLFNFNSAYAAKPLGCTATSDYSVMTGEPCIDGGGVYYYPSTVPACSTISGFTMTKGQSCSVSTQSPALFNFNATDPEGDNLSWYVNWGDNQGTISKVCPSLQPNKKLTASHAWSKSGMYDVKLGVSDCHGGDTETTFRVIVKDASDITTPVSNPTDLTDAGKDSNSLPDGCTTTSTFSVTTGKVCKTDTGTSNVDPKNLPPPSGPNWTAVSQNSILLKWDEMKDADGYNIYKVEYLDTKTLFARTIRGTTYFYVNNLKCGTTYRYLIESFKYDKPGTPVGSGNFSPEISAQTSSCSSSLNLRLLSPNGGSFKQKETINVSWEIPGLTSGDNSVAMMIQAAKADNNYYQIPPAFGKTVANDMLNGIVQNTGSYKWTIPSDFPPGEYVAWVTSSRGRAFGEKFTVTAVSSSLPEGCTDSTIFSTTTGKPCKTDVGSLSGVSSLLPPLNFSASTISQASILLKWDSVKGAQGYNIYEIIGWNTKNLFARTLQGTNYWYTYGLKCGTTHKYVVEAFLYGSSFDPKGSGNFSSEVSAQTSVCGATGNPSLKILSPIGGTYKQGETINVSWKVERVSPDGNTYYFGIYKWRSDDSYYGQPSESLQVVNNPTVDGIYQSAGSTEWTIPVSLAPGKYVVVLWHSLAMVRDSTTNSPFTVIAK